MNDFKPYGMTRILLSDDHTIMREGLKTFLAKEVPHAVIDEAWDADSTIEKIRKHQYDLVVLDINMPNTDSFALVDHIMILKPAARILMFSMNAEEMYARRYLQQGVKGYICKNASNEEFSKAVKLVLENKRYLSPALREFLVEQAFGDIAANPFDNLSSREFEILQHFLRGETGPTIGKVLNLHPSTIGTYRVRIYEKLSCKNMQDVLQLAATYNINTK